MTDRHKSNRRTTVRDGAASQDNSGQARRDDRLERINTSIDVDRHLYRQDIEASRAHCRMLVARQLIGESDGAAILDGLARIETEIAEGRMTFGAACEDIHMHIEARLIELIGPAGGRLHTARSRNDQVATDLRLWLREAIDDLDRNMVSLQRIILDRAEAEAETLMPGFTHLQAAQPITFGHYLMAYFEMFARDRQRLADTRARMNECPLGAAALAGTAFPIDREMTAQALGFSRPMANSIDAVSDRDFVLECLGALSIAAMHLSRLAEEMVVFSSAQFNFVAFSDAFSTGSSIMPQKRNPDAAELVRAKLGRICGAFQSVMMMMKALPLAYSKDMQEDKSPLFEAVEAFSLSVEAMTGMLADMTLNRAHMASAAATGHTTATDLADWLVRELDLPFRQAHAVTGRLVALADEKGLALFDLSLSDMQSVEPRLTDGIFAVLSPKASVESRRSFGGTAPDCVRAAIRQARKDLS